MRTFIINAILLFLFLGISSKNLLAQTSTAGASDLSSIESKANSIEENKKKIKELEAKITQSYPDENDKLNQIKKQLSNLNTEKANALYELRNGYYCSKCNTPRSEFEARGESFTAHLAEVSGRAVPASDAVVKQKMDEYDRKIAAKEDELRKFTYEENEFVRKRAEWKKQIQDLHDRNAQLCQEITSLSNSYKTKVVDEAKNLQTPWINELMSIVAEKHFIEDRIDILNVKLADLDKDEAKALSELKDKVYQKNEADKKQLRDKISANNFKLQSIEEAHKSRMAPLRTASSKAKTSLGDIDRSLMNTTKLLAAEITQLQNDKKAEETRIENLDIQMGNYEADFKTNYQAIENDTKKMNDEIWNLTVNYSKILATAEEQLKKAFTAKRTILNDAKVARTASLQLKGSLLVNKKESSRQKLLKYAAIVDGERIRLLNACQKAQCSCYGADTHGDVIGNWNKALGCVSEMEGAHFSADAVYGCVDEGAVYKQYYQTLLDGLSDSDIEALQRKSTRTRYDMIFKKVTN